MMQGNSAIFYFSASIQLKIIPFYIKMHLKLNWYNRSIINV